VPVSGRPRYYTCVHKNLATRDPVNKKRNERSDNVNSQTVNVQSMLTVKQKLHNKRNREILWGGTGLLLCH